MDEKSKFLGVQETDAITEKIEHASIALGRASRAGDVNEIYASVGSYIMAHPKEVIASLDFTAYGIDPDPKSSRNAIKVVALLALTDKHMRTALLDKFNLTETEIDEIRIDLRDSLEDNNSARNMADYLDGCYGNPFGDEDDG